MREGAYCGRNTVENKASKVNEDNQRRCGALRMVYHLFKNRLEIFQTSNRRPSLRRRSKRINRMVLNTLKTCDVDDLPYDAHEDMCINLKSENDLLTFRALTFCNVAHCNFQERQAYPKDPRLNEIRKLSCNSVLPVIVMLLD